MAGPHEKPPRPKLFIEEKEEEKLLGVSWVGIRKIVTDTVKIAIEDAVRDLHRVENELHELKEIVARIPGVAEVVAKLMIANDTQPPMRVLPEHKDVVTKNYIYVIFDFIKKYQKDQETALECLQRIIHELEEWEFWAKDKISIDGRELLHNSSPPRCLLELAQLRAKQATADSGVRGHYWRLILKGHDSIILRKDGRAFVFDQTLNKEVTDDSA